MVTPSKVAVVTGAGRGIGRAVASRLAKDGFFVITADRDGSSADESAATVRDSGGQAESLALDVSDRAAVLAAFAGIRQRHGRLDAVVNNAMWIRYAPITGFDEDTVEGMFGVGVKAAIWTMQAAVPIMRAGSGGAIVNLSSPAAVRSVPGGALYSAVKGAVTSLTLQAAGELGGEGIRVNAVLPGAVPTPGARSVVDDAGYELRKARTPVGRLGTPEDIAAAVSFLVSPDAGFVNGHVLAVDGGFLVT
ncbi:oxidoreductase [Amycolatopsis deserti]|uniref:Oxidoreductase n=1 Tax=Amycolatopsis deserti TaxID=185696 RepID=A0ABQ3IGW9_9PSEU|nr:SDR family oxidoreductase [Amycolatopsis deserti]GHE80710.1 oxidoreductase [Amycolatopsis deserti]